MHVSADRVNPLWLSIYFSIPLVPRNKRRFYEQGMADRMRVDLKLPTEKVGRFTVHANSIRLASPVVSHGSVLP